MWLTGIDEAGYGPLLGPLVMTAVTFELPDDDPQCDLWSALNPAVRRPGDSLAGALVVGDSKRVFSQARGLASLELPCLAFARPLLTDAPLRLDSLLSQLGAKIELIHGDGPWYEDLSAALPLACDRAELDKRTAILSQALSHSRIRLHAIRSAVVPPGHYNRMVAATGNKADALFELCSTMLTEVLALPGRHTVVIDKHGGRNYYASLLAGSGLTVSSMNEGRSKSSYRLALQHGGVCNLSFVMEGDQTCFPVSLASMFSKYLREALMAPFNRYWQTLVPGLKSTAGYAQDGRRFLQEIEPARLRAQVDLRHIRRDR